MTKLFRNHNGKLCLYVTVEDGCVVIKDNTYKEHSDFYWFGLADYLQNKHKWREHLSSKTWVNNELLNEIEKVAVIHQ